MDKNILNENENLTGSQFSNGDYDHDIILAQDIEGEFSSGIEITDNELSLKELKNYKGNEKKKFANDNNDDNVSEIKRVSLENERLKIIESSPKGRFVRFDQELGCGAFKHVYRGFDQENGREIAWNVISVDSLSEEILEKIQCEIAMIKKLNHPNIINFVSGFFNEEKKEAVIITEIFTGGSLKQHLEKIKYQRLKVIKTWCKEILKGLKYLHESDPPVIHRDIKCDNIFINSNTGQIKIGDLGYSCILKNDYAKSASGTPEFMAPDVLKGRYGVLVDIYSFGMCVLEMVTLEKPYKECENVFKVFNNVIKKVYLILF